MKISKYASVGLGIFAIILGIIFEKQNVAYMVGLAFAIAASTNFPILLLSIYWKKITTRGVLTGGSAGLITCILLVILGPIVWVEILNNKNAIFPYKYPALFSMSVTFIGIWFFSITDNSLQAKKERKLFNSQYMRSQIGKNITGILSK